MVLINSCLSSIPLYMMGVFMLPETVHRDIDSIRSKFFWGGMENKRKYHLMNWKKLCTPKDYGGLGFMDIRAMNTALLCKWIYHLEAGNKGICYTLLRNKYCGVEGFFQSSPGGGSFFWKCLHKVQSWTRIGGAYKLGTGRQISFWRNTWIGDLPLYVKFYHIFEIAADSEATVCDNYDDGVWKIELKRSLTQEDMVEWDGLNSLLDGVVLGDEMDEMVWCFGKSGFRSNHIYRLLVFGGVKDIGPVNLWKSWTPLKIKIFLWLLFKGRIPVGFTLQKMGWRGDPRCKLCGANEDMDHIFFRCQMAQFVWCFVRDALGWADSPLSLRSFIDSHLMRGSATLKLVNVWVFSGCAWALWLQRNCFVFQNRISHNIMSILFRVLSLLKQWEMLAPVRFKAEISNLLALLHVHVRSCL
ncbi:hypothetical protein GUJ93_ZPchr0006g43351 [Zizania palustris]|uniref:Reverse transcriptase zinc-binding domain-containing protein n=1 Tax=Zizania palustris TaxID=103762 RepID=A0A8J5VV62_ZIZPA|nr:hypothetical protein GUJ93_ZPchr0006g43351 [Zizania palustris]